MKIGILGSGSVGQTIGAKLAELGHEVMVGTRDTSKLAEWGDKVKLRLAVLPMPPDLAARLFLTVHQGWGRLKRSRWRVKPT
jgi:predicted dinucleotide-binding enzyme